MTGHHDTSGPRDADARHLLDRLLHLGRVLYRQPSAGELTSAQWAALRYLGRANRFSRSVSALAEFQATTRGTASRMVSELEDRGLARRRKSDRDGRRVRIDLTPRGKATLERDPLGEAADALQELPPGMRSRLARELAELTGRLDRRCGGFGTCGRCRHLDGAGSARPRRCACRRFGTELSPEELGRICVDFEPVC